LISLIGSSNLCQTNRAAAVQLLPHATAVETSQHSAHPEIPCQNSTLISVLQYINYTDSPEVSTHFTHWGVPSDPSPFFPPSICPLSLSPFLPLPLIQLGSAVSSPSGSWRSPADKRILVHFEVKLKHFRVLQISCIVSLASFRTAIDLFYDGTNHTINYFDKCVVRVIV